MIVRQATPPTGLFGLLIVVSLLAAGCQPGASDVEKVIGQFMTAVQEEDIDRLYCLSAGAEGAEELGADEAARRTGFESWVRAHYQAYLDGRDAGWMELDQHGIGLVKLFALGRGTFFSIQRNTSSGPSTRVLETRLVFGYQAINLSLLSPGTTFYLCGAPVGRVESVVVPSGHREVRLDVLESVRLEWQLVKTAGSERCAPGWAVAAVKPIAGSEVSTPFVWQF
jgi:hypothetical protein